ncbi:MAG: alpha/beta hydrolase [Gemmataceae bacterium]
MYTHRILAVFVLVVGLVSTAWAQEPAGATRSYKTLTDISYHGPEVTDEYARSRCKLDLYHPDGVKDYPTVVWFHGGGLTGGSRTIPQTLKGQGIAVIAVDYRLSPKAKAPAYIEDAAAAVAWTFKNIEKHGGSARKVFVSGHSAGGYLAAMVGLDKRWLAKHQVDANAIAGLIPCSGQAITHYTIRKERGIPDKQPVIDDLAPLNHVRKDAPPLLILSGDRNSELLGRYEENAYLWRMMKEVGHTRTELLELQGYNHGQMVDPALPLVVRFVKKHPN